MKWKWCIKTADPDLLRPNKASFPVKNPLNRRLGAWSLPPSGYAPVVVTRLFSNPSPTTGECVHFVRRGHFRSHDKNGGDTTRSAIVENSMLQTNFIAVCFIARELLPIEVLHSENRNLLLLWLLWPWTWPDAVDDLNPTRVSACFSLRRWGCRRQAGIHYLSSSRYRRAISSRSVSSTVAGFPFIAETEIAGY